MTFWDTENNLKLISTTEKSCTCLQIKFLTTRNINSDETSTGNFHMVHMAPVEPVHHPNVNPDRSATLYCALSETLLELQHSSSGINFDRFHAWIRVSSSFLGDVFSFSAFLREIEAAFVKRISIISRRAFFGFPGMCFRGF